jgi:hypothetical protein
MCRHAATLLCYSLIPFLCLGALPCSAEATPAPKAEPHVHNYGDVDQTCVRWTNECRICGWGKDNALACSNIGIACQPTKVRCLQRQQVEMSK